MCVSVTLVILRHTSSFVTKEPFWISPLRWYMLPMIISFVFMSLSFVGDCPPIQIFNKVHYMPLQ